MDKRRILRIIDVNTNRAREGLRVVEEIARFILDDQKITRQIKNLRQLVKKITIPLNAAAWRRSYADVGRNLYHELEAKRENLLDIFKSNLKRGQEALRCLEEFSKLLDPGLGRKFKKIRFELYDLESRLAPRISKLLKLDFNLYLITDPMRDPAKVVKEAIKGGIKIVQLRDKTAGRSKYLKMAKKLRAMTRRSGVVFIVNDNVGVAKKVDADGVHLGQEDLDIKRARRILGEEKLIGVSTHNLSEALMAEKAGADYISVGNIFDTPSKPGKKGIGVSKLKTISKKLKVPVVAIGGIDQDNINLIRAAGVERAAVIRAISQAQKVREKVLRLERQFS